MDEHDDRPSGTWGRLGETVLGPGPALIYLVLLLSLAVFWLRDSGRAAPAPAAAPLTLTVSGGGGEPLTLPVDAGPVLLRLEVDTDDPVRVELRQNERAAWSAQARPEHGIARVVLRPERLPVVPGVELVVDDANGNELLRRGIATGR